MIYNDFERYIRQIELWLLLCIDLHPRYDITLYSRFMSLANMLQNIFYFKNFIQGSRLSCTFSEEYRQYMRLGIITHMHITIGNSTLFITYFFSSQLCCDML